MKKTIYWTCTALVALVFVSGGIFQAIRNPGAMQGILPLGYPVYFVVLLGIWKVVGGLAIVAPGLQRAKEWAYAGITFDLTTAAISHAVMHSPTYHVVVPTVLAALALASWALRPEERKLAAAPGSGALRLPAASLT